MTEVDPEKTRLHDGANRTVVREVTCKTILNRSSIFDYSLNCYTGCTHGCVYCYARFMQRFHPHPEPWGEFVDVKVNAPEALERQLRRAKLGAVFVSSACDGWQPIEKERELTRQCCRLLVEHGYRINVLTKSALVLRDLDLFAGSTATIGVTITTLDEQLRKLWEPEASSIADRLGVLIEARRLGLRTSVMLGPLLPFFSDDQLSLNAMFRRAADLEVDSILVDALNPRPKVWESVARLLGCHWPDLRRQYRRILFDSGLRGEYIAQLMDRVNQAARLCNIVDRVQTCF